MFDGACVLCSAYARRVGVEGELVVVDARENGGLTDAVRSCGLDPDRGMVLKMDGKYLTGSDALHALASRSSREDWFGKLNRLTFGSPLMARFLYPFFRLARWLFLKVRGVAPL